MTPSDLTSLRRLARLFGVHTEYRDVDKRVQRASPEALLSVLQSPGAQVKDIAETAEAERARRLALWQEPLKPVNVVWDGQRGARGITYSREIC